MILSVEKYDSFEALKSAPQEPVTPGEQARNYELFRSLMAEIRAAKEAADKMVSPAPTNE